MRIKTLLSSVLTAVLCVSTTFAVEDQGGEINQVDSNGLKQGKWVFLGKDRPDAGYPAEGKIEEGPYVDNRKEGIWIRYHNDGVTPKLEGEYHNSRPDGKYKKYWPDGTLKEEGIFKKRKYQDTLKRFRKDGSLEYEAVYNESGNESGRVVNYYPNGQIQYEYFSQDGILTGKATRYYENGDVKEVTFYSADGVIEKTDRREMVNPDVNVVDPDVSKEKAPAIDAPRTKGERFKANGYNKVYNENDEIWQDGQFKSGRLYDGKVYEYDEDGILLKVKVFKNGVYHSDGQL